VNRAYSILHVKAVDADRRMISGIATTPEPDRQGDIVEPRGVKFKNPLPLLLHHDHERPVGRVTFHPATDKGIPFDAVLPLIDEPGTVKDRVDEAWHSVKAGLIQGVSIGFRVFNEFVEPLKSGGRRFLQTEVLELSLVTIPANASATIATIKSLDLAATGHHTPGVTGNLPVVRAVKAAPAMSTVTEQITSFENTRAAKSARMHEIMSKSADAGVTLDSAQTEEYDTLSGEVSAVDAHLVRLRALEKSNIATATPIAGVTTQARATEVRSGHSVVTIKADLPKGTAFTRYVQALAATKGNKMEAIEFAKRWDDSTPEVSLALKAAVNPGTIAEPAWAAPLAVVTPMANEFLDLLRPATLIGKIPGLRKVPFNISMPIQTGGGTYGWVGEGAPKPVGNLQFLSATLGIAKSAGIIVISEELAKVSSPSAESVIRNDMIKGMAQFLDTQFIDPTVAAVANVSPASITNASVSIGSAGTSADNARTDIKALIASFVTANQSVSDAVLIMSESNAFALSVALNPLGQPLYPGLTAKGGVILGITVITSQVAGTTVALIAPNEILFADDGGVNIDVSREASVEMSTTPTSPSTASTVLVSLWQQNLVGLRAERFINWKRARLAAVRYTTATYV
jgi:HK97 family phage major capsid protein/HK97 family phage prohead protease